MPTGRRHGRPVAIALFTAVATAAVVTAVWVVRRDDGAPQRQAQPHPAAPVHSEGQVETAPGDTGGVATTAGEPVATSGPVATTTQPAPTTVTTAARRPAPAPATTSPPPAAPAPEGFIGSVAPIDDAIAARMTASWRPGCPVPLADLRLVSLTHWDFEGQARPGEIVVHRGHADRILRAFADLYAARFPMQQVRLVDEFGGDDDRSMAANNTSGFNCRYVAGTRRWSQHAFGRAIDVNPVQNPYVTAGGAVRPPEGRPYVRRDPAVPGLITAQSPAVAAFARAGWPWGGRWRSPDYQHFSSTGG